MTRERQAPAWHIPVLNDGLLSRRCHVIADAHDMLRIYGRNSDVGKRRCLKKRVRRNSHIGVMPGGREASIRFDHPASCHSNPVRTSHKVWALQHQPRIGGLSCTIHQNVHRVTNDLNSPLIQERRVLDMSAFALTSQRPQV